MNVLIIGNNPKHAKIFSVFSDNVYLLLQKNTGGINRQSRELYEYELLFSDISYDTIAYKFKRSKEIRKIVDEKNIDIIFCNRRDDMVQAKIATLFMKPAPKRLVTFHNSTAWVNDSKVKLISKLIDYSADGCICLASFMHEKLLKSGIDSKKLLFLPNTIQHENFIVKDDYDIKNDKVKICYTAVIYPLKNQRIIIEAVNRLKDRYQFEVHLFGDFIDSDYYNELQLLIQKYELKKEVYLDGQIENDDIRKMLPENDIYVSSTTIEMSPYNILEAKASGLPVLASNVLGQCDLIDNGIDGLLYDVNSVEDLAEKLEILILDAEFRKRIGQQARRSVAEEKSYMIAAQKLYDFVNTLE